MEWTCRYTRLRRLSRGAFLACSTLLSACAGSQSTLDAAGLQAERIAHLFWWTLGGGVLIWILVITLALYVIKVRPGEHQTKKGQWLIIGGGILFPIAVLSTMLVYGLALMPDTRLADGVDVHVRVSGEQWW